MRRRAGGRTRDGEGWGNHNGVKEGQIKHDGENEGLRNSNVRRRILSDTMYQIKKFRKSIPLHNRQLIFHY